jgi:hypothetical protein
MWIRAVLAMPSCFCKDSRIRRPSANRISNEEQHRSLILHNCIAILNEILHSKRIEKGYQPRGLRKNWTIHPFLDKQ